MNTFGTIFKFTTWGESHGKAIGCVIDGVPSGIEIDEAYIQNFMDQRKPASSKFVSQRKEADKIEILSGLLNGVTLGSPISIIVKNEDARSEDYKNNEGIFRPSHADYTYFKKYGIHSWQGGGRSSARETACRVMAGAVARKILPKNLIIQAAIVQLGKLPVGCINLEYAKENALRCPDPNIYYAWEKYLLEVRKNGDSIGAKIKIIAKNVPLGLGQPVYGKLDAKLSEALMGINAVKSVEIGNGSSAVELFGSENADQLEVDSYGDTKFLSNNSGGIQGGISNGEDIEITITVKPTSSILKPLSTTDTKGNNTSISTNGRHDPCIAIRACPVAEAMVACVLADFFLINRCFKE